MPQHGHTLSFIIHLFSFRFLSEGQLHHFILEQPTARSHHAPDAQDIDDRAQAHADDLPFQNQAEAQADDGAGSVKKIFRCPEADAEMSKVYAEFLDKYVAS